MSEKLKKRKKKGMKNVASKKEEERLYDYTHSSLGIFFFLKPARLGK